MRKRYLILTAAALTSILIGGCSKIKYYDVISKTDTVELRLCWNWANTGTKAATLREITDNYLKRNQNVSIKNEYSGDDTFYQKLQIDFASQNAPDIISMRPGNIIYNLMSKHRLADLSELYAQNTALRNTVKQSAIQAVSQNGGIYGIPLEERYIFLYLNNDIFKFCNAEIPTTFAELETAIAKIKEKRFIPIAYSPSDDNLLYQVIVGSLGGRDIAADSENGALNAAFSDGLDYLKRLYTLGAFSNDCLTSTSHEQDLLFMNKKAAMIVRDSSFPGMLDDAHPEVGAPDSAAGSEYSSFMAVNFPQSRNFYIGGNKANINSYIKGLGDAAFFASADAYASEVKRGAVSDLLLYFANDDNVSLMMRNSKFIPAVTTAPDPEYYTPLITQINLELVNAHLFIDMPERVVSESVWNKTLSEKIPALCLGKVDSAEIIRALGTAE